MRRLFSPKITDRYFLDKMTREEQLQEDVKRRFSTICGYDAKVGLNETIVLPGSVEEAGDEDPNAQPPADGDEAQGGAPDTNAGGTDMGGGMPDPNAMGGDPNAAGGMDPAMGGDPNAMGADPNAAGGAPQGPEGFNPQDMGGMDPAMGGDPMAMGGADTQQPGDEVVDITELTDKQDDIEDQIKEVGGKFEEVLKAIGSFEELIKSNDEKIEDLKAEIERRNPTQIEKLGNQKNLSYPFNVTPEEYWKDKEANSNYSTEDDNNGKEQGQYVITANDINGDTNWRAIADSLDDKGFLYNQTLDKLLKF